MIITNAHAAELLTLKNENNSTVFESPYNKTTTITSNATIENNLDNKTIPQQVEVLQLKQQIDYTEVGNNNSSTSSVNSTQTKELAQTENGRSSSQGNVTIEAVKNSEFKSPRVSYIENENNQPTPLDYENNYRGSSYNDEANSESSSSRDGDKSYNDEDNSESSSTRDGDKSYNDDEGQELLKGDSDYKDYLLMLMKLKEKAQVNKERENKVTEEIPKYTPESDKKTKDVEDIEKDNRQAETIEDIEKDNRQAETIEDIEKDNRQAETNNGLLNNYYKVVKPLPPLPEKENKIKEDPIDNENKRLISQFTNLNATDVLPDLQIQSENTTSKDEDKKPIANAGLDQILKNGKRIVLDASSSYDPDGKITNYLWKQLGNPEGEEIMHPSNSMIYSFPIPDDIKTNPLEFELTVMDKNGQKDSDTIKISLADEQNLKDNDNNQQEQSGEKLAQIQEVNEEGEDDDDEEDDEEEDNDDDDDDDDNDDDDDDNQED
ncbi:MAG TPA: hypothetical protein VFP49_06670 [Nitrososphaeraceae archaeon]|nr:hypothetical protein [Nitrososphaeraceae archaeon]